MPGISIALLSVLAFILLLLFSISWYFCNIAIGRQKKEILANNPDLTTNQATDIPTIETPWVDRQPFENIEMKSYDGLTLRGYYLQAKNPTPNIAILAHGYTGYAKGDMALIAQLYHETFGFHVFMPDDRGHGASEGSYVGFGWQDRLDYLKWIHLILQKNGEDARIVLHGISMGGATVLMTAGEALPKQVKCIISDCAYTSVKDILIYQLKRTYKLPPFPLYYLASLICKLRAGYFFGEASPLKQLRKANRPILFIHGEEDVFVPTSMIYPLYAESQGYKEKFLVAGAGHGVAYPSDPQGYTSVMKNFLALWMP